MTCIQGKLKTYINVELIHQYTLYPHGASLYMDFEVRSMVFSEISIKLRTYISVELIYQYTLYSHGTSRYMDFEVRSTVFSEINTVRKGSIDK